MKHISSLSLLVLSACGPALHPITVSHEDEERVETALEVLTSKTLPSEGLSITFYRTAADMPEGASCDCIAGTWIGDGEWDVSVSMTDVFSDAPTEEVTRTALGHELVHVLYGDRDHVRAELWGPGGLVHRLYAILNN